MAITFPLAWPTITGIRAGTLRKMDIVSGSFSPFTGAGQFQIFPGQWWETEITLPPFTDREKFETWNTFLMSLRGMYGTFLFGDPAGQTPRGIATGTPVVDGAGQTGQVLNVRGLTPSIAGILKLGDWLQIGTGSSTRLYKNLTDANSDGSGNTSLDLWPDIRGNQIPADGATIILNSAQGLFRLASNEHSWNISPLPLWDGITFAIREAI